MDPLSQDILWRGAQIIIIGLGVLVAWVLWERWWGE